MHELNTEIALRQSTQHKPPNRKTRRTRLTATLLLSILPLLNISAEQASTPPPATADANAARAIAGEMMREMQQAAGRQAAVRVAARHFADQLESRHYPPRTGDGLLPGGQIAQVIGGALDMKHKAIKDYRMDEKVSLQGNTVTIASFASGIQPDGSAYEDVSLVAYQVKNGKIVRADAIHTNPGATQKALRGSDEQNTVDHLAAERIADEMRKSQGRGLEIAQKYFADRIAAWSPDDPDSNSVYLREALRSGIASEMAAIRKTLSGYTNSEDIQVRGNRILLDGKIAGKLQGEPIWGDTKLALSVTENVIVGIESSHSEQGRANLRKILSAAGFRE